MALEITTKLRGATIISGSQIEVGGDAGGKITTTTTDGKTIGEQDATGEVNYDLNGVAYRRNGVAPDGSRAGDWKAQPGEEVDAVI